MSKPSALVLAFVLSACGGAATPSAEGPAPPPAAPPPAPTPVEPAAPAEQAARVPPPPAECEAFVQRQPVGPAPTCAERAQLVAGLAKVLEQSGSERDAGLASLESCTAAAPGLVRALRAELAPAACSDALIEPYLKSASPPPSGELKDVLAGLALAGKASRLVRNPPQLDPPYEKARVVEFTKTTLTAWIRTQARSVAALSEQGAKLSGYGKGVVAIEAGLADMRFVEAARSAPISDDIAADPQAKEAYYATLDEFLEPRKQRGRNAALVGLRKLADVGVLDAPRLTRARALLSQLWSGRRIDSLDGLLLPKVPLPDAKTPAERLARVLPTYYATQLLADQELSNTNLLRHLVVMGFPQFARQAALTKPGSPANRRAAALGFAQLTKTYWRTPDLDFSAQVLAKNGQVRQEAEFYQALARALRGGPEDAAAMMGRGPHLPEPVGSVADLDRIAKTGSPHAPLAAFDAALILELARPKQADAEYWRELAKRYRAVAARLQAEPKAEALKAAEAAEATAKAVAGKS